MMMPGDSDHILTGDMLRKTPICAQASNAGSGLLPQGALEARVMIAEKHKLVFSCLSSTAVMLHYRFVGCQLPTAVMEMGLYQQLFPTSGLLT